ncbi:MAG: hypothetical protein COA62_14880 [Rhodobiaceae bacterium]|nr:MAG: hypothetical protein COA62_14880 [Rhodobiaceae bacterium]
MTDIVVRLAEPRDRPHLIEFMAGLQASEREIEADRAAPDEAAVSQLDFVTADVASEDGAIFLAELDGKAVGFIICTMQEVRGSYIKPSRRRYGYINDLFVNEDVRGQGVAEVLMQTAEEHCLARGASHMQLFVLVGNERARAFYDRSGWAPYEIFYRKLT